MAKIVKIVKMLNKGEYGVVVVELDDGMEAQVFVGGAVEVFLHGQVIKAVVKRAQSRK